MDGWTTGCIDGWMNGLLMVGRWVLDVERAIGGLVLGQFIGCMDGWMIDGGWTDE